MSGCALASQPRIARASRRSLASLIAPRRRRRRRAQRRPINEAREALRKRDGKRLAPRSRAGRQHPLAQWVDYWELGNRISEASSDEVEAFYQRWSGSYVEDRLRNDWLLELGRRRDWVAFVRDYPRFRMNDDREVSCYCAADRTHRRQDGHEAALRRWLAQRDADDGCALMASLAGRVQGVPRRRRLDEAAPERRGQPAARGARGGAVDRQAGGHRVGEMLDNPVRYLRRHAGRRRRSDANWRCWRSSAPPPATPMPPPG